MTGGARSPWAMLALLAVAELFGMSVWFTGAAHAAELRSVWGLSAGQAAWLTTAVQLGFVGGTAVAATANLADLVSARAYFVTCALAAAASTLMFGLAPSFDVALVAQAATGFFLPSSRVT